MNEEQKFVGENIFEFLLINKDNYLTYFFCVIILKLYKFRRQSEAEAKILSEEEIRKRRKEKKKAEKDSANSLEFPTRKNYY
jgi:hypothetical protein